MTAKGKIACRKLSLLKLVSELSNVSRACKVMGYSHQQFYEIRRNFQTYGAEGLIDRLPGTRGSPRHRHRDPTAQPHRYRSPPMKKRIRHIEGSSIAPDVLRQVRQITDGKRVLVVLDSNHTHEHVLAELNAYAPLVARRSYCVVMDTIVEGMPASFYPDRPWGPGNSPKTAVNYFLSNHPELEIDKRVERQLLFTMAPSGYLKRTA